MRGVVPKGEPCCIHLGEGVQSQEAETTDTHKGSHQTWSVLRSSVIDESLFGSLQTFSRLCAVLKEKLQVLLCRY
jgi:hypothetical protein